MRGQICRQNGRQKSKQIVNTDCMVLSKHSDTNT